MREIEAVGEGEEVESCCWLVVAIMERWWRVGGWV